MNTRFGSLLAVIFVLASSSIAAAEKTMYKWTDDSGETHYTERAPKDREYTLIRTYVDAKNASTNQKLPAAGNQVKKADKKDEYGTWRNENCTIAGQNLDILKNAGRISADDGEGGKRLMTDEEKQKKITQMQTQRDKYCKPTEEK
jgi:hypothetical protein